MRKCVLAFGLKVENFSKFIVVQKSGCVYQIRACADCIAVFNIHFALVH